MLQSVWGCTKATHVCYDKVACFLDVGNVEKDNMYVLKTKFQGGSNSEM